MHEVRMELVNPYPAARVSCRCAEVVTETQGKKLVVRIPKLEVYAAVIIEPAAEG